MQRTISYGGVDYVYDWWKGEQLQGPVDHPAALDLETRAMSPARPPLPGEASEDVPSHPLDVPVPALGMCSAVNGLVLIHPTQFEKFILQHRNTHWVGQNFAFDFWCLMKHLKSDAVKEILWQKGDLNLYHDTMLMDLLLQLGTGVYRHGASVRKSAEGNKLYSTNLGVLASEWDCGEIEKTDPYRLRFGELVGLTSDQIDSHPEAEGFLSYAIKDVIATRLIFPKQRTKGLEIMQKAGWNPKYFSKRYEIRPDAVAKYGVLGEKIQVLASIVLAELSRTPVYVDQERRQKMEDEARVRHSKALEILVAREPELLKRSKAQYKTLVEGKGKKAVKTKVLVKAPEILFTAKAGVPQFDQKKLTAILAEEAIKLKVKPFLTKGKTKGAISTSAQEWKVYSDKSEFIKAWASLEEEGQHLNFLTSLNAPCVYARYDLLKTTGRTSAGAFRDYKKQILLPSVNIQQIPRDNPATPDENLRPLFLAPPGHLWCAVDYSYLEFRAMAAVAKAMFGQSEMARVTEENTLRGGPDPHQVTAASIMGVSVEEFFSKDSKIQKTRRQESKPANFGFMGGMGTKTFIEYAKTYGVRLTPAEAKVIRKGWLASYPEMKLYLEDSLEQTLLWGTSEKRCPYSFSWLQKKRLSDFTRQDEDNPNDEKFTEGEREQFWDILTWAAYRKGDEQTQQDCEDRKLTSRVRKLLYYRSCTLTGRVRNLTTYTEQKNSRFQGVSADGNKLALWTLMRRGFKLINFVHDEIGVALPIHSAKIRQKEVERIMVKEMEAVLGQGVPVAVEGEVSPCWSKG